MQCLSFLSPLNILIFQVVYFAAFFELAVGNLYSVKVVLQVKDHWMVYILEYLKWKMGIFPCLVIKI